MGGEEIGKIAPNLPFVHHSRQPSGPRENSEQWDFGQGDGGVAIVDQQNLIACERELVSAARGGSIEGSDRPFPPKMRSGFPWQAGFAGEFVEVLLQGVGWAC